MLIIAMKTLAFKAGQLQNLDYFAPSAAVLFVSKYAFDLTNPFRKLSRSWSQHPVKERDLVLRNA